MQHQLEINGRVMEYILERKKVKNLNLRIRRDGSVYVSADKSVPLDYIENFLRSKSDFIFKAVEHYSEVSAMKESPKKYVDGESFRVLGHDLRLKVIREATNEVYVSKKENPKAKFARLSYETLESKNGKSLLKITLETGRAHQIRVQLSSRGFPIANDHKYNKNAKLGSNIALWAYSLEIEHPVTKEKLVFSKEMPENMKKLV